MLALSFGLAAFLVGFAGTFPLIGGALAARALLRRGSVWGYIVWVIMMAGLAWAFLYVGIPHSDTVLVHPYPSGAPYRGLVHHHAEPEWIAVGAFHAILGLLALVELGRLAVVQRRQRAMAPDHSATP